MTAIEDTSAEPAKTQRWLVLVLGIVIVGVVLGFGQLIWYGLTDQGTVRGEAVGQVSKVMVVDATQLPVREGTPAPDGTYELSVPRSALEFSVVLHGAQGGVVQSRVLKVADEAFVDGVATVRPLAVWTSPLKIQRKGKMVRFNWSPIPEGPGFPPRRTYSILLEYDRLPDPSKPPDPTTGKPVVEEGSTVLLAFEPPLTMPVPELLDYLKEWDRGSSTIRATLRAYDPSREGETGAMWFGATIPWELVPE